MSTTGKERIYDLNLHYLRNLIYFNFIWSISISACIFYKVIGDLSWVMLYYEFSIRGDLEQKTRNLGKKYHDFEKYFSGVEDYIRKIKLEFSSLSFRIFQLFFLLIIYI